MTSFADRQARTIAWGLFAMFMSRTPEAGAQVEMPASNPPTPIEQALIAHLCQATQGPADQQADMYRACLGGQLQSLRADFGLDLSRLSAPERRTIDSACNMSRAAEGRDAYLACLSDQLIALRNKRSRGNRGNPGAPIVDQAPAPVPSDPVPVVLTVPAGETSSWSPVLVGAMLAIVVLAAGGALVAARARRVTARTCRTCGADVQGAGDLCQKCRHEAAEALRRTAMERVELERAQVEEQRLQAAREEEHRRQRTRQEEDARLREQEEARLREESRRLLEREQEEARQRQRAQAALQEEVFDPHALLGVSKDAGKDAIEAGYQEARRKYAPEHVAHLSQELQEHYKRKAEAVERAYQALTEGLA